MKRIKNDFEEAQTERSIAEEEELTDPPTESPEEGEEGTGDETAVLQKERDEYYDLLLRKQAEFENYKRRTERERAEIRSSSQAEVIGQLLPILDACEKGLESIRRHQGEVSESFVEGYELLHKQLQGLLAKFSVSEVPGVGSDFDPNVHEAILREVTSEHREGEVLEEFRKGYLIGERLLRPSQVKVAVEPND